MGKRSGSSATLKCVVGVRRRLPVPQIRPQGYLPRPLSARRGARHAKSMSKEAHRTQSAGAESIDGVIADALIGLRSWCYSGVQEVSGGDGPGLKAASSGSFFRGLKPAASTVVPLARHGNGSAWHFGFSASGSGLALWLFRKGSAMSCEFRDFVRGNRTIPCVVSRRFVSDREEDNRRFFAYHPQTEKRLGPRALRMTAGFFHEGRVGFRMTAGIFP